MILFTSLFFQSFSQDCRERDSLALVALFNKTNGNNWNVKFDFTQPINEWSAIKELSNDGCILKLNLNGNNLEGVLPNEIGDLQDIELLLLSGNKISGEMPQELLNLNNLEELNLNGNQISGSLNYDFSKLNNLKILDLSSNKLTGNLPENIDELLALEELKLDGNEFTSNIPLQIGSLINLKKLNLCCNDLSGTIPSEIGQLSNLTDFRIFNNRITGNLPSSLSGLVNLKAFIARNNRLEGCFPNEYLDLCFLTNSNLLDCGNGQFDCQFNFELNPGLPWNGDFERFCTGEEQINAPCIKDGQNGYINENCQCVIQNSDCSSENHPDYEGLLALYNSTDGPNWSDNNGWKEGATGESCNPCNFNNNSWFGIECDLNGRVRKINLSGSDFNCSCLDGNNLNGTIPEKISGLSELTSLILSGNNLDGIIPKGIGLLSKLNFISMRECNLTGNIPNSLYDLKLLNVLELTSNRLNGTIPDKINSLSNLTALSLSNNSISGKIPSQIGELASLENIQLDNNIFSGSIPSQLGSLANLKMFRLDNNNLSGCIPSEFLSLCYLLDNDLSTCNFFGNNCKIDMSGNLQLSWGGDFERLCEGEEQLGAPCDDGNLDTTNDQINQDCECIGKIQTVNECRERDSLALIALYNATDGPNWTIPWDTLIPINNWHGITLNQKGCVIGITLIQNNLNGQIPNEIGDFNELKVLKIINSSISGSIPPEIGNLENLDTLQLSNMMLNGSIPAQIGKLTNLKTLSINRNQLNGPIPAEISNLQNLGILELNSNLLSGSIPAEIGKIGDLYWLSLAGNKLSGSIPLEILNNGKLTILQLGNNLLTGTIPQEIGNNKRLTRLMLNDNLLIGNIPTGISELNNLNGLFLENNMLDGCIPQELENLCFLTKENLGLCPDNIFQDCQFSFSNNPNLPWQGDFERFCDGEEQIGAPCMVDGEEAMINENCECEIKSSTQQLPLKIIFEENEFSTDEVLNIDVLVTNFTDITSVQFSINWNPEKLRYTGGSSNLDQFSFIENIINQTESDEVDIGEIIVSVPLDDTTTITLPDRARIFSFALLKVDCGLVDILLTSTPKEIEVSRFVNNEFVLVGATSEGLTIDLPCGANDMERTLGEGQITNPECPDDNTGSILVSAPTDFVSPVACTWTREDGSVIRSTTDNCNLLSVPSGTYTLTAVDAEGDSSMRSYTIATIETPDISFSTIDATCLSGGSITSQIVGGTTPFTFRWSDDLPTTQNQSGLNAATYQVTITDGNGCTYVRTVPLGGAISSDDDPLSIELVNLPIRTCSEISRIEIEPMGGCRPYTYMWTGPNGETSTEPDLFKIAAGTWNVTVRDFAGQTISDTYEIKTDVPEIQVTESSIIRPTCDVLNSGSILVDVTGGCSTYIYEWNGPGGFRSTQEDISNLEAGEYTLDVTDSSDAGIFTTRRITLTLEGNVDFNSEVIDVSNIKGNNGAINIDIPGGGIDTLEFEWSDGSTDLSRDSLIAGEYTLTISDGTDCPTIFFAEVKWTAIFLDGVDISSPVSCTDLEDAVIGGEVIGGCDERIVRVNGLNSTFPLMNLAPGTYEIIVGDTCGTIARKTIVIDEYVPFSVEADVTCETVDVDGGMVTLVTTGGSDNFSVEWSGGTLDPNDQRIITGLSSESYSAIISDGCEVKEVIISTNEIEKACSNLNEDTIQKIIETNVFTPDNSSSNNVLRFSDDEVIDNSELWIYNRWGDEIYHKKNYTNDWDGGGYPGGVYFYVLKIGDTIIKKTLTILR